MGGRKHNADIGWKLATGGMKLASEPAFRATACTFGIPEYPVDDRNNSIDRATPERPV